MTRSRDIRLVPRIGTFALAVWCAVGSRVAAAQEPTYPLHGRVVDARSNEPLAGATVYIPAQRVGAVSDSVGAYRLDLEAGIHLINVSYLGFQPREIEVELRGPRRLDVALQPGAIPLGEVAVEAKRYDERDPEPTMQAVSIPVAELATLPAILGEVDALKALQLLPGVQSGTEGTTGLYVRGGGPDQNLILLDGTPLYNPSHLFGFLSVFNTDALGEVRLVKGGFPARYGGRLSSVVEIGMKEGNRDRFEADGTVGLVFSSLTVQGPLVREKASFIVSARRTYIDVLARPFLDRRLPAGQRLTSYFYDLNTRWTYVPSRKDRLSLSGYYGHDVYGSTYEQRSEHAGVGYLDRNSGGAGWGNRALSFRWHRQFSDRAWGEMAVSGAGYRFRIDSRLTQIVEDDPPVETFERVSYASGIGDVIASADAGVAISPVLSLRSGATFVRHVFDPGVSEVRLRLADAGLTDTVVTTGDFSFRGNEGLVYAESLWDFEDRFRFNLGWHASAFRVQGRTYVSLQPRAAFQFAPRADWSLDGSFGTMRQYLHLLTHSGINLPADLWLAATDRIAPQSAWQAALGIEKRLAFDGMTVGLEAYYKRMDGLIEYKPGATFVAPDQDWQDKVVVGRGWASGIEFLIRKRRGRTTGWLGYTLAWSGRRFPELNGGRRFPYRYDRRHDVALVLQHALHDALELGLVWVYGTGQAITLAEARFAGLPGSIGGSLSPVAPSELQWFGPRGGYRMAPYHRLDVAFNRHFDAAPFSKTGRSTLSFGAYNLYNRHNPFYLFVARGPNGERRYRQASLFPVLPHVAFRFHY